MKCYCLVVTEWGDLSIIAVPNNDLTVENRGLAKHIFSDDLGKFRAIQLRIVFTITTEEHDVVILQVTLDAFSIEFGLNKHSSFDADDLGKHS